MIDVRGVVKRFNGFAALDHVTMRVPKGSIYGLLGPNGAGKTTLIRHLTGIYRQDEGEVTIDGEQVFDNPVIKGRIAYIPDDVFYFVQSSTWDMMRFYQRVYPQFDLARYHDLKEVFRLDEHAPIRRLSKGMQKQSAFWLALSMCPELLILDEPVDGLDPVKRRQVWSLVMDDVTERGTTVMLSSHNLREMEDVCDHVGMMQSGKLVLERSLASLQENTVKLQVVMPEGGTLDVSGLSILNARQAGKMETYVVAGAAQDVMAKVAVQEPIYYDLVPLSLEEIFIYELGGERGEVKDIVL